MDSTSRIPMRFRLRTLLVLVGLMCVFLGWRVNVAYNFERKVRWISSLDGQLYFDWQQPTIITRSISTTYHRPVYDSDGLAEMLIGYYNPRSSVQTNSHPQPEQSLLSWLTEDRLHSVEMLTLPITQCSSSVCEKWAAFPNLKTVLLSNGPGLVGDGSSERAVKRLGELEAQYPSLRFRTVLPDFEVGKIIGE